MEIINKDIPVEMQQLIDEINEIYGSNSDIAKMFSNGIKNTYQTTIMKLENDETFVITGDIPAMWNRDSAAQVRPLLNLIENDEIKSIIKGVCNIHKRQILHDPYANAFNLTPRVGDHSGDDITEMSDQVWERKYEIDSLCYPIQLSYLYYKYTNDYSIFDEQYLEMSKLIVSTFKTEQNHHEQSPYSFRRIADWLLFDFPERIPFETLNNNGKGAKVSYTGMTWSGFRPSDDACKYGYLVPSNMFAVVVLGYLEQIITEFYYEEQVFLAEVTKLKVQIDEGIKKYGIIKHPEFGDMYAYEVDGLGNYLLMDDANVPSLLAAPYLGYCSVDDPIYQNTRKFILSKHNPYYYQGEVLKGVGSPHTPENYIWNISMAVQGMTTSCEKEKEDILNQFVKAHGGTFMMHEGIDVNDPNQFTRPWFSWANSMYSEFILELNGMNKVKHGVKNEI